MIHGFDVSAYQGATAPVADFVFVKATEGKSYTSSKFKAQYASAKAKAKHRGGYHFARPEQSTYKDQAARFLDIVQPKAGESVWLDLEASQLSQGATNTWARGWGDYILEEAPGITSGIYLGSGYVSNGTGRDLSKHFARWWYPQYPGAYQIVLGRVDVEEIRARNRSSVISERRLIAAATTKWPPAVSPWLPATNTTGWEKPDLWQFTDNWQGMDASVTALTVAQLAGGGTPPPKPPAPKPKPWSGRYLKYVKGEPLMHGSDVSWVQQHLTAKGHKVEDDGEYGKLTAAAVGAFQKASKGKLAVDSVVGEKTWDALAK